jgi:hypothetical protein
VSLVVTMRSFPMRDQWGARSGKRTRLWMMIGCWGEKRANEKQESCEQGGGGGRFGASEVGKSRADLLAQKRKEMGGCLSKSVGKRRRETLDFLFFLRDLQRAEGIRWKFGWAGGVWVKKKKVGRSDAEQRELRAGKSSW